MRFLTLIVLMTWGMAITAQADSTITYQGQVQQGGSPHDGDLPMTFHLFEDGVHQPIATIDLANVAVKDGLFQVELDFGDNVFTGQALSLEVVVDGQALSPRQPIRHTPVALFALDGNEGPEGPVGPEGPAGASPFELIGDAVEYVADGQRIGFYPDGEGSSSFIAGHQNNQADGLGATVAGGGLEHVPNLAKGNFSAIGGGFDNRSFGFVSTIGGGASNVTGDDGDPAIGLVTTIAGGFFNVADGDYSTIGGGIGNHAFGEGAVIAGGEENQAIGDYSFIGGGGVRDDFPANIAYSPYGVISGGYANTVGMADQVATAATIGGGANNSAIAFSSTISGGQHNIASMVIATIGGGSGNTASSQASTISGGTINTASGTNSTVSGGMRNTASGRYSVVGGGLDNSAILRYSTVSGGRLNCAGGRDSWAGGYRAKVRTNTAQFALGAGCEGVPQGADIEWGDRGTFIWADSTNEDFISTGEDQFLVRATGGVGINTNNPHGSLDVQGGNLVVGEFSADHRLGVGTTSPWTPLHVVSNEGQDPMRVMVDNNDASSTSIRAYGHQGVAIGNSWSDANVPERGLRVWGDAVKPGGGSWSSPSDERLKQNVEPIDSQRMLAQLLSLQGYTFEFTEQAIASEHGLEGMQIGLLAQEVAEVFPDWVGNDGNGYLQVTERGMAAIMIEALRAIRGEQQIAVNRLQSENAELRAEVAALKIQASQMRELADRNRELENRLAALETVLLGNDQLAGVK